MIDIIKNKTIYNKLMKLCTTSRTPMCPICNDYVRIDQAGDADYIKTKRGTEIFIHTACAKKWGE